MELGLFLLTLGVIIVAGIYFVTLYNQLVAVKHNVSKAWANIDIALQLRHDELPKLIEVCRQYKEFEQATLEQVISARSGIDAARSRQDVRTLGTEEGKLAKGLGRLFAVAEAYPELKTNENFMHLQARITDLESAIADRREFYNESVNINNVSIEQFPNSFIANIFNFQPLHLLKIEKENTADIDIKTLFNH